MIAKLASDCCYRAARCWLSLGRMGSGNAHRLLRLALRLWPKHPQALPWLHYLDGYRALRRGEPEQAVDLLRSANRDLPAFAPAKANLGVAYTLCGRFEEAIRTLERLLRESDTVAGEDVWTSLCWAYIRSGRPAVAREVCRRAYQAELHSPRLDILYRLASGVGIGSLPVSEMRRLLNAAPEITPLLLEYARMQAREGRHRLARSTISVLPEDTQARGFLIMAQGSLNEDDPDTAMWAVEQVFREDPGELAADAMLVRSEVALRRGDYAGALNEARKAQNARPENGRAHDQAGRALFLAGRWDETVDEMIEALHCGHDSALAAGVAALAALEVEDTASARGMFVAQRFGDGLACAVAHAAQLRIVMSESDCGRALELAQEALRELSGLPSWLSTPPVVDRLIGVLRGGLRTVVDLGDDEQKQKARELLADMEDWAQRVRAAAKE